jgi:hypothetical protein
MNFELQKFVMHILKTVCWNLECQNIATKKKFNVHCHICYISPFFALSRSLICFHWSVNVGSPWPTKQNTSWNLQIVNKLHLKSWKSKEYEIVSTSLIQYHVLHHISIWYHFIYYDLHIISYVMAILCDTYVCMCKHEDNNGLKSLEILKRHVWHGIWKY